MRSLKRNYALVQNDKPVDFFYEVCSKSSVSGVDFFNRTGYNYMYTTCMAEEAYIMNRME